MGYINNSLRKVMLTKLSLIFKSLEFYTVKEKNFWLSQEWDDVHNDVIDNTPRIVVPLIFAVDWYVVNQRPSRTSRRAHWNPEGNHYRIFSMTIFLGYYQIHIRANLALLPYKTYEEYLEYKKST